MIQLKLLEHRLLRYAGITLGCMIASCSINLFLVPSHLLTGGATGIAMIVYYLTHLPIGAQTFAYNIPLLMAAWRLLGKGYTCDVVIGTAIFSFCLDFTKPLNAYAPVNDYMLAAIFGGVFNGIGYGMFYSFNMGGVIFGFNCLVMLAAAFMFGVAPAMFTLICMFMNAMVTDKVIAGFNSRKALLIVSNQAEAIAEGIMEVGRGVTFLHGQGAFTRRERNVVFVVVTLTQVAKMKMIINAIDPDAFVIIMSASEVMGHGFSSPGVKTGAVIHRYSNNGR